MSIEEPTDTITDEDYEVVAAPEAVITGPSVRGGRFEPMVEHQRPRPFHRCPRSHELERPLVTRSPYIHTDTQS